MAWIFGDSFDLYASVSDASLGYWDSNASIAFVTGRFAGSQAIRPTSSVGNLLVKTSGANDAVHHFVVAMLQTTAISGVNQGLYILLADGATNQCSIVFRTDGSIILASGGPNGTVLATYTGAFSVSNTWYAFEFEVVINNTTGSFRVRTNGASSDSFVITGLNTRVSANNYANKLFIGQNNLTIAHNIDDFLWRSDPSSVPWVGDIRCYVRMPASDASKQFAANITNVQQFFNATIGGIPNATPANTIQFGGTITASQGGTVTSLVASLNVATTGHVNLAVYDNSGAGGTPGNLVGTSTPLTNPGVGLNTFTVTTPFSLTKGAAYYMAVIGDASCTVDGPGSAPGGYRLAHTYSGGAFPSSAAGAAAMGLHNGGTYFGWNLTPANNSMVNEAQQDGLTTYVYDSTVNDADFYGIASIPVTPVATIAVTTRALAEKSDAGTRSGAVQIKSGSSTVTSPSTVLSTSWGWLWRTDVNDPATGAAWTAAAVNNATIGPVVTV